MSSQNMPQQQNIIRARHRVYAIAILWLALILSGCTTTHRSGLIPVAIANNISLQLLEPAASQPAFVESQWVTARFGHNQHELMVQIESINQTITLVALTATGTRLASVSLSNQGVSSDVMSILPAHFDIEQLLAAYQLSTRSIKDLQANLDGDAFELREETQTDNRRLLLDKGEAVITINFSFNDQQQATILYQHHQWDYTIHITTLSKQLL
jgi:hypothetical protein